MAPSPRVRVCPLVRCERPQARSRGPSVAGTRRAGLACQGHCAAGRCHVRSLPRSCGPCTTAPGAMPGQRGRTPARRRPLPRASVLRCTVWQERPSLHRPTCSVTRTEGRAGPRGPLGHLGCCGQRRPGQLRARPAGGVACVKGRLQPGPRLGGQSRGSCARCGSSPAGHCHNRLALPLVGGVSSPLPSNQEPPTTAGEGAGRKGPLLGAFRLGDTALRVCASGTVPALSASLPRERFCEMSSFQNFCPFVCFIVRAHK